MSKSKASDYFTAGIILIVLAGIIWLLENFILSRTVDKIIFFIIPGVFVMLSVAHLVIAGAKWNSSR